MLVKLPPHLPPPRLCLKKIIIRRVFKLSKVPLLELRFTLKTKPSYSCDCTNSWNASLVLALACLTICRPCVFVFDNYYWTALALPSVSMFGYYSLCSCTQVWHKHWTERIVIINFWMLLLKLLLWGYCSYSQLRSAGPTFSTVHWRAQCSFTCAGDTQL